MSNPIPESVEPIVSSEKTSLQTIGQAPLLPPREPVGARLAAVFGRHQAALVALCVLLLWAIVAMPPLWRDEPYQVGAAPGHDILVPQQTFLLDSEETRRRQDDAANLVTPDYDPNPNAQAAALADLGSIVRAAQSLLNETQNSSVTATKMPSKNALSKRQNVVSGDASIKDAAISNAAARLRRWRARYNDLSISRERLPDTVLVRMAQLPPARWSAVDMIARQAIGAVYKKGQLRSDVLASGSSDLAQAQNHIRALSEQATQNGTLSAGEAKIVGVLAMASVVKHPNQAVNERQTEVLREVARHGVQPVYMKFKADETLVRANEIITERRWSQMQEMGVITPSLSPKVALARLAFIVLLVFFGAAYLKSCHPALIKQPAALWLTAMVPVAFAFGFRLMLRTPHAEYLMVPFATTAAMLLTVLTNARVGVVVGFTLSALCSIMARTDATWLLAGSLASSIASLCVANLSSLLHVVRAGGILALTNAILFCTIGVLSDMMWPEIGRTVLWEAIAGVGAVAFMSGLALLLERPFGITTHFRLIELLSPGEAVMRRLQAEAPGTYTHSLMVALLAEAAAKAVGADPLLCHVGGLYHDIGKLRRPHCFIENQSGHNIHDELSPQLSALIILAHVKDGLELGRALRLPQPVLDIVAQHHGTTVLSYFYNRALQGAPLVSIPAADVSFEATEPLTEALTTQHSTLNTPDVTLFRYAGPRPQSKEAALVLLADSIEASSRSLPEVTPEKLRAHIQKMISLRLQEGELSECELTMRDLGTIETTFTHVLRGVLHQRILYPGQEKEALQDNNDWMREKWSERQARTTIEKARRENRPEIATDAGKSSKASRRRERKNQKRLAREAQQQAKQKTSMQNHTYESSNQSGTISGEVAGTSETAAKTLRGAENTSANAQNATSSVEPQLERGRDEISPITNKTGSLQPANNQSMLAPGDHGHTAPRATTTGTFKERAK